MRRRLIILITLLCSLSLLFVSEFGYAATSQLRMIPKTKAKADRKVVTAFEDLGFKVQYKKNLNYAGLFSVREHAIILKSNARHEDENALHEMGHFLSRLHDGADTSKEFRKIYKAEKQAYDGRLKAYQTKNSKEYFAQSFAEYSQTPNKLKTRRPRTYEFIKETIKETNHKKVEQMYNRYGWAW